MSIILGVLLIGVGIACLAVRVAMADQLEGILPIVVSMLGVAGVLAGGGLVGRAFKSRTPS